jgi:hypothetical protein
LAANPVHVFRRPGGHLGGRSSSVAKQKLAQPMTCPQLIFFSCFAGADQISQSLVRFVGNPHRRQVAGTMAPSQFLGIAAIGLHSIASFREYQCRRNYLAVHSESR